MEDGENTAQATEPITAPTEGGTDEGQASFGELLDPAQPAQDEASERTPSEQPQEFMPGKFKTPEDMRSNWLRQNQYIGKLQALLKKHKIDLDGESMNPDAEKIREEVRREFRPTIDYVNQARIQAIKSEILREFPGFDFDKNNDKLRDELAMFDAKERTDNPVKVLKRAIRNILSEEDLVKNAAASAAEKGQAFSEPANGNSQGVSIPQDEADQIIDLARKESSIF